MTSLLKTKEGKEQHALLIEPLGKPESGQVRYAAAMYMYMAGMMSAEMLEIYRRCSKFDSEDPVEIARLEQVDVPEVVTMGA